MNERIQKIKTHIYDWRYVYITGAVSFVVGGAVVYILKSNSPRLINNVTPIIALSCAA